MPSATAIISVVMPWPYIALLSLRPKYPLPYCWLRT
jgi:hypothetical protein